MYSRSKLLDAALTQATIAGATAPPTYYINVVDSTAVSVHGSAEDAIADTGRVDLSTAAAETHLLDPVRYVPASATGTIGADNFSSQITMIVDEIATG